MRKDLIFIIDGWEYNPDDISARSITGADGYEKIQMRLDLGVLQMEVLGRPDGKRPYGHESLLEYFQEQRYVHCELFGSDSGFTLEDDECAQLRQESMQYYYRYLSLFHLERYEEVLRDTAHNLRLFDFVNLYATSSKDRAALERMRPDLLLMNTRAEACLHLLARQYDAALRTIDEGIDAIHAHWVRMERPEQSDRCKEIRFLQDWRDKIELKRPLTAEQRLRRQLQQAVEQENYEQAAQLRDQLKAIVL